MIEAIMSRGFCRFAFWLNVVSVVVFFIDVLVFRTHQDDIAYIFAFVNTLFAWKYFWPRCEYDMSWYRRLVAMVKWKIHSWKSRK